MHYLPRIEQSLNKDVETLTQFIESNPDPRELKRALAIRMSLAGDTYRKIEDILGMSKTRISFWKQRFSDSGIDGIKLGYQGRKSHLTSEQRAETIKWLKSKDYFLLEELVNYLDENYAVLYKSRQSYYDLFEEAGISWKKSQKINPKHDPELVKKSEKRCEIFWHRTRLI